MSKTKVYMFYISSSFHLSSYLVGPPEPSPWCLCCFTPLRQLPFYCLSGKESHSINIYLSKPLEKLGKGSELVLGSGLTLTIVWKCWCPKKKKQIKPPKAFTVNPKCKLFIQTFRFSSLRLPLFSSPSSLNCNLAAFGANFLHQGLGLSLK